MLHNEATPKCPTYKWKTRCSPIRVDIKSKDEWKKEKDNVTHGLPILRFGANFNNKLQCDFFTVIRKEKEGLYDYYTQFINKEFQIRLKGRDLCRAILEDAVRYKMEDLTPALLSMDCGELAYSMNGCPADNLYKKFGIEPTDHIILLLMKRSDRQRKRRFRKKLGV